MKSVVRSAAVLFFVGLLTACGGSSGDPTSVSTPSSTAGISGVVADGYLSGATVCSDQNNNKMCDPSEPQATTNDQGEFTIAGTGLDQFPVTVQVTSDVVDMDYPSQTVGAYYVLTAPAGKHAFVSPLTSLVQYVYENNGLTLENAEAAIQGSLGFASTTDLFRDYIAETGAEYRDAHKVAQVVARAFGNNFAISEAVLPQELNSSICNYTWKHIYNQLNAISQDISASGASFDPNAIAGNLNLVNQATIQDDVLSSIFNGRSFYYEDATIGEKTVTGFGLNGAFTQRIDDGNTVSTYNAAWQIINGSIDISCTNANTSQITILQDRADLLKVSILGCTGNSFIETWIKTVTFQSMLGKAFKLVTEGSTFTFYDAVNGTLTNGTSQKAFTWGVDPGGVLQVDIPSSSRINHFYRLAGRDEGSFNIAVFGEDHTNTPLFIDSDTMSTVVLTVKDPGTSLVWQKEDDNVKRNWYNADTYCTDLTLDGYMDWRMPTKTELDDLNYSSIFSQIEGTPMGQVNGQDVGMYWSSTSYSPAEAYHVFLTEAGAQGRANKSGWQNLVRCVR